MNQRARFTPEDSACLTLPLTGMVTLILCYLRLEPLLAWFLAAAVFTVIHLYFAFCSSLLQPWTRLTLRITLLGVLSLWAFALPSAAEWEIYCLRPGMTQAQVASTLQHFKPQEYQKGARSVTDPRYWYLSESRHHYGWLDGIYLTFTPDQKLVQITPCYD